MAIVVVVLAFIGIVAALLIYIIRLNIVTGFKKLILTHDRRRGKKPVEPSEELDKSPDVLPDDHYCEFREMNSVISVERVHEWEAFSQLSTVRNLEM